MAAWMPAFLRAIAAEVGDFRQMLLDLEGAWFVARYADHLPLYRQTQMMARQGVEIDRVMLAFWVGCAAAEIGPVVCAA